ncbi:GNAT family N-acetyltransferase [Deinococcus lacus]|uniref:GNAT family N-acetyltransferase n=1 Tax=Deinococcus lacus TaxID=392561 RepID=A0ABW1YDH0_9DEIO
MAEDAGQVVGVLTVWQNGGRFDPRRYEAAVTVHPDRQGGGLGRELAARGLAHLRGRQAREIVAGADETDARSLDFLGRQGFTEQFRYFDNVLDLREWDAARWPIPPLPDGVRLLTLADLIHEQGEDAAWHAFHAAFAEARQDVPSQMPPSPTLYEVFRRRAEAPGYSPHTVFLAVTDAGEVAALTELKTDPQDAALLHIGLTGTRRAWRRRGLAQAVKLAGLHWARGKARPASRPATPPATRPFWR